MAGEKLGLTQWGTQYVLGSLRDFIDEGIESPGFGEALKSRQAALLKFIITITKLNLPSRPKFDQLEGIPLPFGPLFDLSNITSDESFEDHGQQLAAVLFWLSRGVTANGHTTAISVSRNYGVDP